MSINGKSVDLLYLIGVVSESDTDYRMGIEYLRGYLCQTFSQRKASVGGRIVADKLIEHLFESEARRVIERGNLQKRDSDTDHCQRHQNKP